MPTIEDAILLATILHRGQKDKIGEPYILHPLRVMLKLETEEGKIVGVLHDTLEDCGVTPDLLRSQGYSDTVIEALLFLTKLPEEEDDYEAFIQRITTGPILAQEVKIVDISDNMLPRRFPPLPTERDLKRRQKYERALKVLRRSAYSQSIVRHEEVVQPPPASRTGPFPEGTLLVPRSVPQHTPPYLIAWGTESITDKTPRKAAHVFEYAREWWVVLEGIKGMFNSNHFQVSGKT
jgi:hypothetical protein